MKDDTTCLVVDVITTIRNVTAGTELSLPSPKKAQKLKALFLGKKSHTMSDEGKAGRSSRSVGSIEELFEEGSAMLEKRQAFLLFVEWEFWQLSDSIKDQSMFLLGTIFL